MCCYFCVLSPSWAVPHAFFLSNSVICPEDQICPRKHLESHSVFQERVLKPRTCQGCGQQLPLPGSIPYHRLGSRLTGTVLQFLCGSIPCRMHTGRQVCCAGGVPSPLPCTSWEPSRLYIAGGDGGPWIVTSPRVGTWMIF